MEIAAFIAIVLGVLCVVIGVGSALTPRKRPMARYINTDILPPPSAQCERPFYREHA